MTGFSSLEIVGFAACVFWFVLSVDRSRAWPREAILPRSVRRSPDRPRARVLALVPARNEARSLPRTLPSLLRQLEGRLQVLLVDDDSEDETAKVAAAVAAASPAGHRLRVLEAGARSPGWSGKTHALEAGYRYLRRAIDVGELEEPDWVLLTDADILWRDQGLSDLLRRAMGDSPSRPLDLASVMVRLSAVRFWERLLTPAFVFFFQLLYPFRKVADPSSSIAAAAGGCILLRWQSLRDLDGFGVIHSQLIDDVALARAVKGRGGRVWLGLDSGLVSIRPYDGLGGMWRMVSRTAFTQLRYSWVLLLVTLLALVVLVVSPPLVLALSLAQLSMQESLVPSLIRGVVWASAAWGMMFVSFAPAVHHHRVSLAYAALLPCAAALFGLMTLSSAWDHWRGRGAAWRGRRYSQPS